VSILRNEQWSVPHELAQHFGEKSGGLFYGTFGSLDGVAIRIVSPSLKQVPDPGNYCCRKGFFALNVQATCDNHKRFLWCHPMNKGSSHDSSAFAGTKLIELLQGLHLVDDSAHPLCSFLQVPCDQQDVKRDPLGGLDAYNYHLSGNRIWIECAFGELVMRRRIFWRTLRFDIFKSGNVVLAAMLLHNFIVENRLANNKDEEIFFRTFATERESSQQMRLTWLTGESPRASVVDNNEPRPLGRTTESEKKLLEEGAKLRNVLMLSLARGNLRRPMESGMRYNDEGLICMTY